MIKIPKVKNYKYMKDFLEEKCFLTKTRLSRFISTV